MRAVHLTAYGDPVEGVQLVHLPDPLPPRAGEALIGVDFAPVDFSDILVALGTYPKKPQLPSIIGNEGGARVLEVGPDVEHVRVGDRVLVPSNYFSWVERMVVPAASLYALPSAADPLQLAMLRVNPSTAGLILSEYVDLAAGDWIVQNAATSGVGRAVIAIAKARGLRTINLVRRDEPIPELYEAGADLVLPEEVAVHEHVAAELGDVRPRLAIDGVAGVSTSVLAAFLGPGGTLVSYAAASRDPLSVSAADMVFKRLAIRGFFLGAPEFADKSRNAILEAAALVRDGGLRVPVAATYPLSAIRDAMAHAVRGGKVMLDITAA